MSALLQPFSCPLILQPPAHGQAGATEGFLLRASQPKGSWSVRAHQVSLLPYKKRGIKSNLTCAFGPHRAKMKFFLRDVRKCCGGKKTVVDFLSQNFK